jgi:metallo-beta-lactamase family protein
VREIQGLSAHADRRQLLYWFQHFDKPPDQLVLTHGEEEKALALADRVRDELGWKVVVPKYLESVEF